MKRRDFVDMTGSSPIQPAAMSAPGAAAEARRERDIVVTIDSDNDDIIVTGENIVTQRPPLAAAQLADTVDPATEALLLDLFAEEQQRARQERIDQIMAAELQRETLAQERRRSERARLRQEPFFRQHSSAAQAMFEYARSQFEDAEAHYSHYQPAQWEQVDRWMAPHSFPPSNGYHQQYPSGSAMFENASYEELLALDDRIKTKGFAAKDIDMFPVMTFKKSVHREDTQCTICYEQYEEGDRLMILPPCTHAYHAKCAKIWLKEHRTCPVCRVTVATG